MGEIEPQHDISVYSLHVVYSSNQSLHGMMIELNHTSTITILILEISGKGTIVSFTAHEIG